MAAAARGGGGGEREDVCLSVVDLEASAPSRCLTIEVPHDSSSSSSCSSAVTEGGGEEEEEEGGPETPGGWRAPRQQRQAALTAAAGAEISTEKRLGAPPAPSSLFVGCLSPSSVSSSEGPGVVVSSVPLQVALLAPGKHEISVGGEGEEEVALLPPAKLIVEA